MFGLFVNDILYSFWQNTVGDAFLSQTISKLELAASTIDLIYYPGVKSVPTYYDFDSNKNLLIQDQVITLDGAPGEEIEVISYVTNSTVNGTVYYAKGVTVIPC